MKIAVLLTSFNRKEKTLACLRSLENQQLNENIQLETFLMDDCSTDGTATAVEKLFPGTRILHGNGKMFWAGGMRYCWNQAIETNPDFFLLLNDDTILNPHAMSVLLKSSLSKEKNLPSAIVIGSTCDENSGKLSYGGWRLKSSKQWKSERVYAEKEFVDCDFGNANIMLVPSNITKKIGILAPHFTHSLADYDYTLRAKRAGFSVRTAPGFLGSCTDDHGNNYKSQNTTLKERILYLKSPKGLAYKEYLHFIRDHFPLSYIPSFFKLWLKTLFPIIWIKFKKVSE